MPPLNSVRVDQDRAKAVHVWEGRAGFKEPACASEECGGVIAGGVSRSTCAAAERISPIFLRSAYACQIENGLQSDPSLETLEGLLGGAVNGTLAGFIREEG
jgi:hypothetical protein